MPLVIGRSPDIDVVINDSNVSRRHAEVWRTNEGVAMRDLESTNGTYVNGHRISAVSLSPRDDITVGLCILGLSSLELPRRVDQLRGDVRPLQVLVMVVAILFFFRVLRVGAGPGTAARLREEDVGAEAALALEYIEPLIERRAGGRRDCGDDWSWWRL